jgi:hypothetical protein
MDSNALQQVNQEIYRKYPEFKGVKPTVKAEAGTGSYLLTYQVEALTANDRHLTRYLRVSASSQGKILKISTSR